MFCGIYNQTILNYLISQSTEDGIYFGTKKLGSCYKDRKKKKKKSCKICITEQFLKKSNKTYHHHHHHNENIEVKISCNLQITKQLLLPFSYASKIN